VLPAQVHVLFEQRLKPAPPTLPLRRRRWTTKHASWLHKLLVITVLVLLLPFTLVRLVAVGCINLWGW